MLEAVGSAQRAAPTLRARSTVIISPLRAKCGKRTADPALPRARSESMRLLALRADGFSGKHSKP